MCSILLVDSSAADRQMMAGWATGLGHEVREADSPAAALTAMAARPADVVFSVIDRTGEATEGLITVLREQYPEAAVIVLTARCDANTALSCLRQGVLDLLAHPAPPARFREALARGVAWNREASNARRRLHMLQQEVSDHLARVEEIIASVPVTSDIEVERLLAALETDRQAVDHAHRVAALASNIAVAVGVRNPELGDIRRAALLHGIGRIAIPPTILCKTTRLSEEEVAIVRQQPGLVARLLERHPFLGPAAPIVAAIFERFDGTGYPHGLRGEEIPRGSRVLSVADALDAMTHCRAYKPHYSNAEAVFEVSRGRGTQFSPEAVDALLNVVHLHWGTAERRAVEELDDVPAPPLAGESRRRSRPELASGWPLAHLRDLMNALRTSRSA